MLLLRILLILAALVIVISGGMYLFTRQPTYLRFAWQVVRFTVYLALIFGALYVLERYVLIGWRVLF